MRKNLSPINTSSVASNEFSMGHPNSTSPTYAFNSSEMTRSESQSYLTISATKEGEIVSTNFNQTPFGEKPAWFIYIFVVGLAYWALYFAFVLYGKVFGELNSKFLFGL